MDLREFVRANTAILSPPLVPEVRLHLAHELLPIWQKTEEEIGEAGVSPPFWAFAWAGGQALARYVLDAPGLVASRPVLDLASGSGLVAIAAAMAGASTVRAVDCDQGAAEAIALNAAVNGVRLFVETGDALGRDPPREGVVLVGDFFYEKETAPRLWSWLEEARNRGSMVLIGDPGRTYLPVARLRRLAEFCVPVSRELEDSEIKRTMVWEIA
jgi:predicted nicotinamide N-methyase